MNEPRRQGYISDETAQLRETREKLRQIRDSDHPASPWARNVVQTMDELKADPNDPVLLRQLGKNVAMFERMIGAARPDWTVHILTAEEIAAIFGLGGHHRTDQ